MLNFSKPKPKVLSKIPQFEKVSKNKTGEKEKKSKINGVEGDGVDLKVVKNKESKKSVGKIEKHLLLNKKESRDTEIKVKANKPKKGKSGEEKGVSTILKQNEKQPQVKVVEKKKIKNADNENVQTYKDSKKTKKQHGLPPPPTSPEPVKEIKPKQRNTVGLENKKLKTKVGLPPPPTPSPEPKKMKASIKKKGKVLKSNSTPIPPPLPEIVKPKVEKMKKAVKVLGNAAPKTAVIAVKLEMAKSTKPEKLGKKKIKKGGLTGKLAYDEKKLKKMQKEKAPSNKIFEAGEYNEEQFNKIVNIRRLESTAKAVKEQAQANVGKKNPALFSDYVYMMSVCCYKIPNAPKRMVKLKLKHSLVAEDDDVVIVVADLQRGAKADFEPTIQHYEDLFREKGIEGLKVMPFNQLRQECKTFEAVRKFGNTYDYFLVDGRIAGRVVGFCGKIFQKPRTTFHSVHMDKDNLKEEIDRCLRRTAYKQLQKGDLITIPIANHKHSAKQVAENMKFVIEQLKLSYPGGMENVRGMFLKIDIPGTASLPFYLSLTKPPEQTPYIVGPREKRMLKLRKEANDVLEKFSLSKDGELSKLSKKEVERKMKIKETKAKLLKAESDTNSTEPDGDEEPIDSENDADGEPQDAEDGVPAKKPRRDDDVQTSSTKKGVERDEDDDADDDENDDEDDEDGSDGEEEEEEEFDSGEDDGGSSDSEPCGDDDEEDDEAEQNGDDGEENDHEENDDEEDDE